MDLRKAVAAVERREKAKHARSTILLRLPLFEGEFAGRFGVLEAERLEQFDADVQKADLSPEERNGLAAEFIADACRRIEVRADEDGKYEPVEVDGAACRFDEPFAQGLGLELSEESSAGVVLACWTVVDDDGRAELNSVAMNRFGIMLLRWMEDTTLSLEGEVVGESQGSRPS